MGPFKARCTVLCERKEKRTSSLTGIAQLCAGSNTWSFTLDLNNSELFRVKVIYQFLSVYLVSLAVELLLILIDSDLLANSKTLFLGPDLWATKEALWIAEDLCL